MADRSTSVAPKSLSERPGVASTTSASRVVSSSSQVSIASRAVASTSISFLSSTSTSTSTSSTISSTLSTSSTHFPPSSAVKHTTPTSSYSPSPTVPINSNTSHQRLPIGVIIAISAIGAVVVLGVVLWHLYPRCSCRSRRTERRRDDSALPPPPVSGTFGGGRRVSRSHSMYVDERHYLAVPAIPRHSHTRSDTYTNPFETALEKSDSGSSGDNYPTVPSAPFRLGDAGGDPASFSYPPSSSNSLSNEKADVVGVGGPSTRSVLAMSPESLPSHSSSNASSLSIIGARSSSPPSDPPSPAYLHHASNVPPNSRANNNSTSSDEAAQQTFVTRRTSQASSLSSHASTSVAAIARPAHPSILVPGLSTPTPNNNPISSNPNLTSTSRRVSRDNSTSRYSTYSTYSGNGQYGHGSSATSLRGNASLRGAPHLPHIRPQVEIVLPRPLAAMTSALAGDNEFLGVAGNDVESSYRMSGSRARNQTRSPLYEEYYPSANQAAQRHPPYSQQPSQQQYHVPRINPTSGRRRSTTVEGERQREMGNYLGGSRQRYSLDEESGDGAKMRDSLGLMDELGSSRHAPSAWRGSTASGSPVSQQPPSSRSDSLSLPPSPAVPVKDSDLGGPASFIRPGDGSPP